MVGRDDQLDVDRALGGAAHQVGVRDVAVVLAGADHARREVVGAQEVEEVDPLEAVRAGEHALGDLQPVALGERLDQRGRDRALEVDVQLGERERHTRPRSTRRSAGGSSLTCTACSSAVAASVALCVAARVHDRQRAVRADLRRRSGRSSLKPDAVVDLVVLAPAVAAQAGDDEPDGARVDAVDVARALGRHRARHRRRRQLGLLDEVRRPAERADTMRPKVSAALPSSSTDWTWSRAVSSSGASRDWTSAAAASATVTSCRRGSRARARQVVDRLAHLERVARRRPQHLVHVGDQRDRVQPGAARDLDQRLGQLLRVLAGGHERARAGLDVEHQRVEALGQLLGQDRGHDQRDRLDRAGGVADRVQAAVGGREVRGLADDRAAGLGAPRA